MKKGFSYLFLKRVVDKSTRFVSKSLPTLGADECTEILPAIAPFHPLLPQNIEQLPPSFARFFREEVNLPPVRLFTLRQVSVSWQTLVFDKFRIFRPALPHSSEENNFLDAYLLKQWVSPRVQSPTGKTVALVHDQWTRGNYYHWMVDSLSRLLVLRERYPQALLFMPEPAPNYIHTSAVLFGYKDFLPLEEPQVLQASRLVVPEHVTPPGFHHPVLLPQVRATLVAGLWPAKTLPVPTRSVYVSRSRQNSRHLRNEAEAMTVLERHGFEVVYFEDMSLEQQVHLMLETRVFVGVHGANLTNLLFLQPGATVVELMNEEKFLALGNQNFENLIYYRMCSCLGLPYFVLPCQNVPDQPPSNYSDVLVDLAILEQMLTQL